jgi:hypothetical protein
MQIGGKRWTIKELKEFLVWAKENGIDYVTFGDNSFSFRDQSTTHSAKLPPTTPMRENTIQSEETEVKSKIGGVYDDADLYNSI